MEFAEPGWLWLLVLVPVVGAWTWWRDRHRPGLRFSNVAAARGVPPSHWSRLRALPAVLRMTTLALGILALARPQERNVTRERFAEGVDIMMVLDTSTSMRAQDFTPNRFEAARNVGAEFIRGRVSDRIGLIVFAAKAYTQAPLTLDYDFLLAMLREVEIGVIEDGTAIGTALATAVARLKDSEARSKVIILLTDGQNNRGEISPETAAEVAATMGVRIYAIGVGARGEAPFIVDHPFAGPQRRMVPVEIDEEMLQALAEKTGGKYFRATDNEALRAIYREIGELEKTKIEERVYVDHEERYAAFLWPAFGLLLLELLLVNTRLRRLP
ncbi:VWA domain-containing protein [Rhodocaloribacter litoris]|uniref:vWA domain-containing protein n=1 Tax=Rhodocaloribacter litoris TaxID=2558931 RepID=UPI001421EA34|nr:VWA domain-containing protein [Rhodocaloribacter litoris]QXD14532.1 VWA domain-containing protein [Rhodocaloribacter litoris]